jgi:hypothetical protein
MMQIIKVQSPSYSIAELCKRNIITPIKKWVIYCNLQKEAIINPYVVGALYCKGYPYMFGGLNIYNRYRYTTQIAERHTIYNTEIGGEKIIAGCKFIFKKVSKAFFRWEKKRTIDDNDIIIMSEERALLQMLDEQATLEFVRELPNTIDPQSIQNLAQQYCSKKVLSRLQKLIYG